MLMSRPLTLRPRPWSALPVILVPVFVTTLDFFIANVAMPSIRADLGSGSAGTQLVTAAYGLAYAAGLLISGRLGDVYGARRMFVLGLALFTLASVLCGVAPSMPALIAARVLQGSAAAILSPQVLTLLGAAYRGPDRKRAFGWYGTATGLAGISGQVIGGLLVSADLGGLGWRACFLLNLPIGVATLAMTRLLPELPSGPDSVLPSGRRGRVDVVGAALVAGGLTALVMPFVLGPELGWPGWVWLPVVAAVPLLTAFGHRQRSGEVEPLLDLGVFLAPGFVAGLAGVALLFASSAGLSFVLALYLQDGAGMSPVSAAAIFTSLNAGFFAASLRAPRRPLTGALLLAGGFARWSSSSGAACRTCWWGVCSWPGRGWAR